MKKVNTRTFAIVTFAVGSLLLAGCSGQSLAETKPAPGNDSAAIQNPVPSGDLAAGVLKGIAVNKDLAARVPAGIKTDGFKVATADGYPPMEMFDKDGKTMVGIDMSLMRAIGNMWGVKVVIDNADQNSMIPGVASGRYDVVISGLNDTAARREKVTFVDYAKSSGAIIVAKGNPKGIKAPADLCGKTLAVLDNGFYMQLAKGYSDDCTKKGQGAIQILGFASDPEALLQLQNGRADAGMNDFPVGVFRAKEAKGAIEAIEIPGTALFGIGIDPTNKELVSLVQDTMTQLMQNGNYGKIFASWDLTGMAIPEATINKG